MVKAVIRSVSEQEWLKSELDYRPQRHFPADKPFIPYRGVWRPFPVDYAGQLYHDRALPLNKPVSIRISDQGLELSNNLDDEAELIVVLRNRSLEAVQSVPDIDTSLPPSCLPGELIIVAGHQLKLIEVRDG